MSDDWEIRVVTNFLDLFVDHKTEDTELGSTSVVQFDGTLLDLFFFGESIPAEVNVSVTEVTNEFVTGSWDILHESDFEETNEADDLSDSVEWDSIRSLDGGNTVRVRVEGVTGVVDVSWKVDSGTGDDVTEEGQLSDTSVLDFDVTETVEAFFISTVEEAERIPESKRRLDTKFVFEGGGLQGGGGGFLGRSEGSSRGDKGGKDGGLHLD